MIVAMVSLPEMRPSLAAGRLLVATPLLTDSHFHRTVVLLLEHHEQGALGVVLNRPSDVTLARALPPWAEVAAQPRVVFIGGPVSPESAIGLALREGVASGDGWRPLLSGLGTIDLARVPADFAGLARLRVFVGYAGWVPGQLEAEVAQGAWFVLEGQPGDALTATPGDLWRRVLRRQRGLLSLYAAYPPDPAAN